MPFDYREGFDVIDDTKGNKISNGINGKNAVNAPGFESKWQRYLPAEKHHPVVNILQQDSPQATGECKANLPLYFKLRGYAAVEMFGGNFVRKSVKVGEMDIVNKYGIGKNIAY